MPSAQIEPSAPSMSDTSSFHYPDLWEMQNGRPLIVPTSDPLGIVPMAGKPYNMKTYHVCLKMSMMVRRTEKSSMSPVKYVRNSVVSEVADFLNRMLYDCEDADILVLPIVLSTLSESRPANCLNAIYHEPPFDEPSLRKLDGKVSNHVSHDLERLGLLRKFHWERSFQIKIRESRDVRIMRSMSSTRSVRNLRTSGVAGKTDPVKYVFHLDKFTIDHSVHRDPNPLIQSCSINGIRTWKYSDWLFQGTDLANDTLVKMISLKSSRPNDMFYVPKKGKSYAVSRKLGEYESSDSDEYYDPLTVDTDEAEEDDGVNA